MKYGLPYMGSKSRIAKDIVPLLPAGKRLVDLFGGGGAITHFAIVEYGMCWSRYLYNDVDPLIVDLWKRVVGGEFAIDTFVPVWISREEFHKLKHSDGYVKYLWSFGNNGKDYMYGKHIENTKRKIHHYIVYDEWDEELSQYIGENRVTAEGITNRLAQWRKYVEQRLKEEGRPVALERAKRVQDLTHFSKNERIERAGMLSNAHMQISNISYEDYVYQNGDVVYCDIPYENTRGYSEKFNQGKFAEWATSRPYRVYISSLANWSYRKNFKCIWDAEITSSYTIGGSKQHEALYLGGNYGK